MFRSLLSYIFVREFLVQDVLYSQNTVRTTKLRLWKPQSWLWDLHAEPALLQSLQGRHHASEGGQAVQISRRGLGCSEGQSGLSGSISSSVGRCRPCDTQSSSGCTGEGPNCNQWCPSRCVTRFVCQVRREEETTVGEVRRGHGKAPDTSCICGRGEGPFGVPSCRSSCADAPTASAPIKTWKPMCPACQQVIDELQPELSQWRAGARSHMDEELEEGEDSRRTRKGRASSLPEHLLPSAEVPRQHPVEVQVPPVQSSIRVERLPC